MVVRLAYTSLKNVLKGALINNMVFGTTPSTCTILFPFYWAFGLLLHYLVSARIGKLDHMEPGTRLGGFVHIKVHWLCMPICSHNHSCTYLLQHYSFIAAIEKVFHQWDLAASDPHTDVRVTVSIQCVFTALMYTQCHMYFILVHNCRT